MSDEKQTLANIIVAKQEALALIQAADGEMTPEFESLLDKVERSLETKTDSYAYVEAELEAQAQYFKDLAKQMASKAKQIEQMKEHLRSRIKLAMQNLGVTEMSGVTHRYSISKLKPKLVVTGQVSEDYGAWVTPPAEFVLDKERVESALKFGVDVPGCHLEPVYSLRSTLAKAKKKVTEGNN